MAPAEPARHGQRTTPKTPKPQNPVGNPNKVKLDSLDKLGLSFSHSHQIENQLGCQLMKDLCCGLGRSRALLGALLEVIYHSIYRHLVYLLAVFRRRMYPRNVLYLSTLQTFETSSLDL